MEPADKHRYSISDLLRLVGMLRFSNSFKSRCHESIRSDLIEKAYDVLEAIDLEDSSMLKEKLGDILLQIIYHCDIEDENNQFSFDDIVDDACKKLVADFPNIFYKKNSKSRLEQKCKVYNIADHNIRPLNNGKIRNISKNLDQNKIEEVPKALPALVRAFKIQERAAKFEYGLFSVEDALNETFERLHYLETLILDGREGYEKELGNLIFSIVEISRLLGVDAESALYGSCERFKNEFLCKISLENTDKV